MCSVMWHRTWHIVQNEELLFLLLALTHFFSLQDLDVALPIIEKYKDRLLAIGEVKPFADQMVSNLDLHGIDAVTNTSDYSQLG